MTTIPLRLYEGQAQHTKVIKYPDGQQSVQLDMNYFDNNKYLIEIIASVRNWSDMELLLCIISALRRANFLIENVRFVYLFGQRSDRVFDIGQPDYVADILMPIIKSVIGGSVTVCWPHGRMNHYDVDVRYDCDKFFLMTEQFICIAADESIKDQLELPPPDQEYPAPIHFNKYRDPAALNEIKVHLGRQFRNLITQYDKPILIYDDMCDGGRTFIEEAKYLKTLYPDRKLNLFFYHAVCAGMENIADGFDKLGEYFDRIYCTNSVQPIVHPKVTQFKVI